MTKASVLDNIEFTPDFFYLSIVSTPPTRPSFLTRFFPIAARGHMPANVRSRSTATPTANQEAHLLLGMLMERTGIRRPQLLALLAERGYQVSDDMFTNWGRKGRAFPRNWPLLRAIIGILSQPRLPGRCTAGEALRFFALTALPFTELAQVAALFPAGEFNQALVGYLPASVAEFLRTEEQPSLLERWVS